MAREVTHGLPLFGQLSHNSARKQVVSRSSGLAGHQRRGRQDRSRAALGDAARLFTRGTAAMSAGTGGAIAALWPAGRPTRAGGGGASDHGHGKVVAVKSRRGQ